MNRSVNLVLLPFVLAGCSHAADELGPKVGEGVWLPDTIPEPCRLCISERCEEHVEPCVHNSRCQNSLDTCGFPSPSCGGLSAENQAVMGCAANSCRTECEFDVNRFECLGKFTWPFPEDGETVPFSAKGFMVDARFADGITDLRVAACALQGTDCTPMSVQPAEVDVPVDLNYRFLIGARPTIIYLSITGSGVQPTLYLEDLQIQPGYTLYFPVVPTLVYAIGLNKLDLSPDPNEGLVSAMFVDCSGYRLPGIRFKLLEGNAPAAGVVEYYARSETYVRASEDPSGTDKKGGYLGGFAKVRPGLYELHAIDKDSDRLIGTVGSVLVKGETVTHVNVFPLREVETK